MNRRRLPAATDIHPQRSSRATQVKNTERPRSQKLLRLAPDIIPERRSYCAATHYNEIADGVMTRPIRISPNCSVWPEYELDVLDAAILAGATRDELRKIVVRLHAEREANGQLAARYLDGEFAVSKKRRARRLDRARGAA
jgi:hypothetical protein